MKPKPTDVSRRNIQRFVGDLFWVDPASEAYDVGQIIRAILRPTEFAVDFRTSLGLYSAVLKKQPNGEFRGAWEWAEGENTDRGRAACFLHAENGRTCLSGKWSEDREWRWFGDLRPVAAFPDE
jgi:hypothetical protein